MKPEVANIREKCDNSFSNNEKDYEVDLTVAAHQQS